VTATHGTGTHGTETPGTGPAGGEPLDRAVALAGGHALDTLPNPPVGCVLTAPDGTVVGEGAHGGYGGPHAEAVALAAAGERARGATAWVTLEPCGGGAPGKKTPPCAAALLAAGVAAVVYAEADPSPHGSGSGLAELAAGGVTVAHRPHPGAPPLLVRYRAALLDPFPWTLAKWAMSLDGRIADARGGSRWITGEEARGRVHALRRRVEAVVVGSRTAVLDDPDLRPLGPGEGGPPPLRVVVDSSLRLAAASTIAATAASGPVLVATGGRAREERRRALEAVGVTVEDHPGALGGVDIASLFRSLRGRGVRRLLLEGGGRLTGSAFRAGLVRQVAAFTAPLILGGDAAPNPVAGEGAVRYASNPLRLEEVRVTHWGSDVLVEGFVPGVGA